MSAAAAAATVTSMYTSPVVIAVCLTKRRTSPPDTCSSSENLRRYDTIPSGHRGWSQEAPNKSKMADGRLWKRTVKSRYLCDRLTDFLIWYGDAYWPLTADQPLKFWNFYTPRWRRPPSWKSQKSRYLRNNLTDLCEIWYSDAKWVS